MPSARQNNCKHIYNNRCFPWGPFRRFIGNSEGRLQPAAAEKPPAEDNSEGSWIIEEEEEDFYVL
jgi:hypothetical protein